MLGATDPWGGGLPPADPLAGDTPPPYAESEPSFGSRAERHGLGERASGHHQVSSGFMNSKPWRAAVGLSGI